MTETGQNSGSSALVAMTARYEALVRDLGLIAQLEVLDGEPLLPGEACTRLVALIALEGIAEYCSIMLLDHDGSYLELRAVATRYSTQGFSLDDNVWHGKRFALGEGIAGQVAATGVHVRINDTLSDPNFLRLPDSPVSIRSMMCFPLVDQGETLGVLNLSQGTPHFFDLDRERAMTLVSSRMSRILGKALHAAPRSYGNGAGQYDNHLLMLLNQDGGVIQIGENAQDLTGLDAKSWCATRRRWREHILERDRPEYDQYYVDLKKGLPNDGITYSFVLSPGVERTFSEYALPLPQDGGAGGWIVAVRDESNPTGFGAWSSNHAASRLLHAQRIHTMGQLAGGVVHDLNGLLTGIVGNLDLALVSSSGEESAELVARARTASIRGAEIVEKMLAFSRAGAARVEHAPMNPATVVEEAAGILRCSLDPRIALEVTVPPVSSQVFGSEAQLCQVLVNLGVNARDALLQRGLEGATSDWHLKMGLENIRLDAKNSGPWGGALEGDFVRIYVSDNGTGMPPEVVARIFEPFFTTRPRGKGTGLGLSTAYRIIRHHRGWIDVQSTPRKGTTFNIYLPSSPSEIAVASDPGAPTVQAARACVLLVDDEALVRNLGAAILKRLGYHALTAKDGNDGLEKFRANRDQINLVILDLQMPDMGGEAVLEQIRLIDPDMPVVYSTGMSYFESSELPKHLRPTGMLKKPYLIATMSEIVRDALSRKG